MQLERMQWNKDSHFCSTYMRPQRDDVQDFDVGWDQAPLSANETLQDFVQLQTVVAF